MALTARDRKNATSSHTTCADSPARADNKSKKTLTSPPAKPIIQQRTKTSKAEPKAAYSNKCLEKRPSATACSRSAGWRGYIGNAASCIVGKQVRLLTSVLKRVNLLRTTLCNQSPHMHYSSPLYGCCCPTSPNHILISIANFPLQCA